jgi:2,4-dienoyl-CoA reductase-like NADH-dependent reductase (Old Yellow Enzyme family)
MTTGFGYDRGVPDARLLAYFAARARGLGMVTVAFGAVRPEGRVEQQIPWMWREDAAAALRPLAATLHEAGTWACLQLGHGGRQVSPRVIGEPPVAPSPVPPAVHVDVPPRALTKAGIREVVAAFAGAATRAAAAGFDAVELHAAHGYLVQQFLSPESNRRRDRYGRDPQVFGVEVIRAMRRAAPALALIVRINGADLVPGGLEVEDAVRAAARFAEAGADALLVSAGVYGSVPYTIPLLDDPDGCFLDLAAEVRRRVGVPVIGVGRVTSPELAEAALERGLCDAVALGRALLADPGWVEKARSGRSREIRPCIATVQGCAGMLQHGDPISCQVNPDVGRELRPPPSRASRPRSVAVVGGGPAGMEAALRAAGLGHRVTLFERAPALGGALRLAATMPPLQPFGPLVAWYEDRLLAAEVEVRLGAPAGRLTGFDLVVSAAGARTEVPALDGYEDLPAWVLEDVDGALGARRPAVLGGASWALAGALKLAAAGARPAVVDANGFGRDTSGLARRAFLARLERAGVELVRGRVERLAADGVVLEGGRLLAADGVVLAGRRLPERPPGLPEAAVRVGDAREPRGIGAAIAEARDAVDAWAAAVAHAKSPPASQRSKAGRARSSTSSIRSPAGPE